VKIACSGALDGRWILIWVFSFETRPAFREAFQRRRCLVPVDGFCEWEKTETRQATLCDRACRPGFDGAGRAVGELAFTGGEWMRSFAIVTTTPNELCAQLHNRMPVVLKPNAWPVWLGEEPADAS
jgi:putative SOS response-associated peptidase YedK